MAETTYLTGPVEDFIRAELQQRFGMRFEKRKLTLQTEGKHEFDAVSADGGAIVASIKATSGRTAGGRLPQGKFNSAIAEIYFLTLIEAPQRLLVLTNPEFYALLTEKLKKRVSPGIEIICIPLPEDMQAKVDATLEKASQEVSPVAAAAAVEAAIEAEADG